MVSAQRAVADLRNQIASHSKRIEQLLQERAALGEQLGKISAQLGSGQVRDERSSAVLREQQTRLTRAMEDKDRELQEAVLSQEKLLSVAGEHGEALEELGNERKFFRFIVGGGLALRRLPDFQLGPAGGGGTPERTAGNTDSHPVDVWGGLAFLPMDFNSRDRHQTFSLGGLVGLGGNGFPANIYTGLTLKVWILYLNAGLNFRKDGAWSHGTPVQAPFWQGAWTPTVFAGLALDSESLLAIQRVVPSKSSPEGLQVDPR
jgi:chorismate mutase